MICPKWPGNHATITRSISSRYAPRCRRFASSSSNSPPPLPPGRHDSQHARGQEEQKKSAPAQWPGLKRRSAPSFDHAPTQDAEPPAVGAVWTRDPHSTRGQTDSNSQTKGSLQPESGQSSEQSTDSATGTTRGPPLEGSAEAAQDAPRPSSKKNMLVFKGLSKNLVASDFYRVSPQSLSLSGWGSAIKQVQQRRDRWTQEPLGIYNVSFATSEAAAAYHDRAVWLQQLAKARAASQNGLWEATIPQQLDMPGTDPAKALESFTLLPPSEDLHIVRARTSQKSWEKYLEDIITKDFGPRPAVVLVHANPPDLSTDSLHEAIQSDGAARDARWKTSHPVSLLSAAASSRSTPEQTSTVEKSVEQTMRGRFVLAFPSDWDARRFQRSWNLRKVDVAGQDGHVIQHTLSVSFIHW